MRSTCLKKHYGAVIVKDDEIIATGYNGSPRGGLNCCDKGACFADTHQWPINIASAAAHGNKYGSCIAVHAEQNALISASGPQLKGAVLYLTGYDVKTNTWIKAVPCNICDRMITNAGIIAVITEEGDKIDAD